MSQLQVAAEQTARATPEDIWALVSDASRYPQWGPWSAGGYQRPGDASPRGPGAVQWLRSSHRAYLRYATTIEEILEAEEGRRHRKRNASLLGGPEEAQRAARKSPGARCRRRRPSRP